MPTALKYIGTQQNYFETAITGRPTVWQPGRVQDVPDSVTQALLGTGLFRREQGELSEAEVAALRSSAAGRLRTVLIGDSMTDWYHFGGPTISTAVYAPSTGLLTITYSSAHNLWTGIGMRVWHYSYTSMRDQVYVPITVTGTTVVTVQLAANLSGVPAGDITSGLFPYLDHVRANANFVNWIQCAMGWPLYVVRNAAQSGDTSAGNLRRLTTSILDYRPNLVIGQMVGINDLSVSNGPQAEAAIITNNAAMFDAIRNAGAALILGTITPVAPSEARATRSNMLTVLRLNDWLREYARSNSGVVVIDHYRHIIDIAQANGCALTARVRNDNIHPATKSAILIAKDWISTMQRLVPIVDSTLPKSILDTHANSRLTISSATAAGGVVTVNSTSHGYRVGDEFRALGGSQALANGWFTVASESANAYTYSAPGVPDGAITGLLISRSRNLFINPLLQTTTGGTAGTGVTGSVAAGLACSAGVGSITATASVAAAVNVASTAFGGSTLPAPVGNEQVLAITVATTAAGPQFTASGTTAFATQMLVGRSYVFEAVLRLASTDWGATALSNLFGTFQISTDAGAITMSCTMFGAQDATETNVIAEDMRLHVRSPVILCNQGSSVSSADFLLRATVQAAFSAGPTLTMGLSQVQVLDVTGRERLYL